MLPRPGTASRPTTPNERVSALEMECCRVLVCGLSFRVYYILGCPIYIGIRVAKHNVGKRTPSVIPAKFLVYGNIDPKP